MARTPTPERIRKFKKEVWAHYRKYGRHDLPWRHTKDPYAIFVSEVMLQQTQVSRVEGFYGVFLKKFPNFPVLARARKAEVLAAWQGLGYNRRALALKRAAEIIVRDFGAALPADREALENLPGIGKGTSGSLMAFVFNRPTVFIETNIRRAFIHYFFTKKKMVTDEEIERYILCVHERKNPREWYWALMDYGAALAAEGKENANVRSAHYHKQAPFRGSDRELRGRLLRVLAAAAEGRIRKKSLPEAIQAPPLRAEKIAKALSREGFIKYKKGYFQLA